MGCGASKATTTTVQSHTESSERLYEETMILEVREVPLKKPDSSWVLLPPGEIPEGVSRDQIKAYLPEEQEKLQLQQEAARQKELEEIRQARELRTRSFSAEVDQMLTTALSKHRPSVS